MFTEKDQALSDLEQQMLRIVKSQLDAFEADADGGARPLPMPVVQLAVKTHEQILKHMAKSTGLDLNTMLKNPEAALAMLERMKMQILKVLEQRNGLRVVK